MASFHILKSPIILFIVVPLALIPLLLLDTTSGMIQVWLVNETFTHGFLVFPLSLWLIWQKRDRLILLNTKPEPRVFSLLIPAVLCWVIAAAVDVQIVQQFSMISIIVISVWLVIGRGMLSIIRFPLLFLFFAVPFGQSLIPPLMNLTADFTVKLVQLSGIPVYQEGLFFTLPTGKWSVIEECSGVRYLIASFTLGAIYAYLNYSSLKKRLIFIIFSLIVPILGNVLRAYIIVMIGHHSDMKLATGVDHLVYGWVFFGVLIFLMFYAGSFWWDSQESFEKVNKQARASDKNNTPYSFLLLLAIIILIISANVFVSYLKDNSEIKATAISLELPENFAGWQFNDRRNLDWEPIFTNPDVVVSRGYVFADELVQINIAYYRTQRQGSEAISTNNRIVSQHDGGWKKIRDSVIQYNGMYFSETEIRRINTDLLIWQWYKIGEFVTPDPYIAKALDAYNLIIKRRTDAAMITLATRVDVNVEVSRQRIKEFWLEANNSVDSTIENIVIK